MVLAQSESARLGQQSVTPEVMLLGIVAHPELGRRTLGSYGITEGWVRAACEDLFGEENDLGGGRLRGMVERTKAARDMELPFTPELKRMLIHAGTLAEEMGSDEVRSDHVLLSLLGHGVDERKEPLGKEQEEGNGGALAVILWVLDMIYGTTRFSVENFCSSVYSDAHGNGGGAVAAPVDTTQPKAALQKLVARMSDECIGALVTAESESARLKQDTVGTEAMFLGVVTHPELARSTLDAYGIRKGRVKSAVEEILGASGVGRLTSVPPAQDMELSLTPVLKEALSNAARLADEMGSVGVHSEHVLWALLEADDGDPSLGAVAVIERALDGLNTETPFSRVEFATSLAANLRENDASGEENKAELVTGGEEGEKSSATPTLEECGTDLTEMAKNGEIDEVFGRDREIRMALRTLVRRRKNNPCLTGEPGVGKTAIVEGIAQVLAASAMLDEGMKDMGKEEAERTQRLAAMCPPRLHGHRLVVLELANLVAGTKYRGEFEERLKCIIEEVTSNQSDSPPTILFIDEIHTLVGAGRSEGGIDAANMLKPALARGKLRVIGATTIGEYRKYIEKDAALERRLQPLMVKEPSVEETIGILSAIAYRYADHHGVRYSTKAIEAAAKLSEQYVTDRYLPDKAIDLLDEAGAVVHMMMMPPTTTDTGGDEGGRPQVTEHHVAEVVSEWTSIPVGKVEAAETDKLRSLESELAGRVKGQGRAIRAVCRAVRRARSGLRDAGRPVASFLFCGPTGVGKTELCKALAGTYFGSEKDMIRIDMAEYMEKHTFSRLTGPPPGYVGYEEGGQLTEAVRRAPHSVVLLDELEKAHRDVLNILLQIMEDGVLTDGKGRTVDFKHAILVMTSNVGSGRILDLLSQRSNAARAAEDATGGWGGDNDAFRTSAEYGEMSDVVKEELEYSMPPELLNRIDEIVVFSPLGTKDLRSIAKLILDRTVDRAWDERGIRLSCAPSLLDRIVKEGTGGDAAQFGARPMRRAVQRFFEDTAGQGIINGFLKEGDGAIVELCEAADAATSAERGVLKVRLTRTSDRQAFMVDVEDGQGGMGVTGSRSFSSLERNKRASDLQPDPFTG